MKEVSQLHIAHLNNAMRTLKIECLDHEDCNEECPDCYQYDVDHEVEKLKSEAKNLLKDDTQTVFDISRFSKAMDCYKKGIITFEDVYKAGILKGNQLQQVEVELKNLPPQIEKEPIKEFWKVCNTICVLKIVLLILW